MLTAATRATHMGQNTDMRISAKADYAVRATAELAASEGNKPVKGEQIAQAQDIPVKFLLNILSELNHARIVRSHRGADGGYRLARPADQITLAEVIRAVEGPLANVHEARPEELEYPGPASSLKEVWIAVRANLRAVLESVTVADLASGSLPAIVKELTSDPDSWIAR
jgi:Rrf2 family protein